LARPRLSVRQLRASTGTVKSLGYNQGYFLKSGPVGPVVTDFPFRPQPPTSLGESAARAQCVAIPADPFEADARSRSRQPDEIGGWRAPGREEEALPEPYKGAPDWVAAVSTGEKPISLESDLSRLLRLPRCRHLS
jgi:hypothetical protein